MEAADIRGVSNGPCAVFRRHIRTGICATVLALFVLLLPVSTALAGRLLETGEVADVSCVTNPSLGGCHFLRVALDYVRSGAPDPSKPILLFDEPPDNMRSAILAAYGGSPPFSIDEHRPRDIDFNSFGITTSQFSAVVIASDGSCGNFVTGGPIACGDLNLNPPGGHPWFVNDPFPGPEIPPSLLQSTPDSDALLAPPGHQALTNFYNAGGGILVGSGGDNGDGHAGDLYYDFVNAPRGLPFDGDPSSLTAHGLQLGFSPGDIGHGGCPPEGGVVGVTALQAFTCPFNAFLPLPAGSSLKVAEVDAAGNPVTLFQDTDPPRTTITSGPRPIVVTRGPTSATFAFSASENLVTFQCRLDSSGFTPCSSPVTYGNVGEGAHVFSVRAIDAGGNVEAAPPAASWLVAFDRDGDGYTRFSNPPDCNDNNPKIHPGAPEPRGGHVDTDCDGVIDPFLVIRPNISIQVRAGGGSTQFTKFVVSSVPTGATVDIRCGGGGCSLRHSSVRVRRRHHQVSFTRLLAGHQFRVGSTLVVRITNSQSIGGYEALTMRGFNLPRTQIRCMNPGSRAPRRSCPRYRG